VGAHFMGSLLKTPSVVPGEVIVIIESLSTAKAEPRAIYASLLNAAVKRF
jgi:hypothetical protein